MGQKSEVIDQTATSKLGRQIDRYRESELTEAETSTKN